MASSSQLYSQVENALKQANKFSGVNPNDIYQNLVNRVGAFRPQYNELGQAEAQMYATAPNMLSQYYNQYGEAPGSGTSAASRLSSIMDTRGQQMGTMNAMRGSISAQQGNLKDILSGITQQYQNQGDSAWKNYSALQGMYQTQLGKEESARSRASQATTFNIPKPPTRGGTTGIGPVANGAQYGSALSALYGNQGGTQQNRVYPISQGNGMVVFSDGSRKPGSLVGTQYSPKVPNTGGGILGWLGNLFK